MSQILHIFRKDSRMFWPEILVTLAVTAAFAAVTPSQWRPEQQFAGINQLSPLLSALTYLVPLCWYLLIARVVHAESLVGENRVWLTRPYEWPKLLAAKVLFVVVFLCVPLLIAQSVILHLAGFPVMHFLPGLLYNLCLMSAFALLPLFTLATVTANFARMTLTLLGILLYWALVVFLAASLGSSTARPQVAYSKSGSSSEFLVPVAVFVGAILLQYTARRTSAARTLLIAAAACLTALLFLPNSVAIDPVYPKPAQGAVPAIQVAFAADATHTVMSHANSLYHPMISIEVPVSVSGIADGFVEQLDDVKFSLDRPDGFHWESPWQAIFGPKLLPGSSKSTVTIALTPDLYEKLKAVPMSVHLTFAATLLKAGRSTSLLIPSRDFSVPDFGICSRQGDLGRSDLLCRSPLRQPNLTHLTAVWSKAPCSALDAVPAARGDAWIGGDGDLAGFGLSSVSVIDHYNTRKTLDGEEFRDHTNLTLCPGTPITFTQYSVAGRTRAELSLLNFQLPATILPY